MKVSSLLETPTYIIRKENGSKTVPTPVKKVKYIGSDLIPSIEKFRELKLWILKKLDKLT